MNLNLVGQSETIEMCESINRKIKSFVYDTAKTIESCAKFWFPHCFVGRLNKVENSFIFRNSIVHGSA